MHMTDEETILKQKAIILNLNFELDILKKELEKSQRLISELRSQISEKSSS